MGEAIGPQIYKRQVRLSRRTALPDCPELFSSSLVSHVKVETHPHEHHHCLLTDPGTGPCANRRGRARAMPVPLQEHFPSAERSRRDVELQLPILRRICSLFPPEPTGMSPRCVCIVFHFPIPIYSPELCQACSPQGNPPQLLTAKGQTRQPHRSLPTLKLVRGARQLPTVPKLASWQLHRIRTTIRALVLPAGTGLSLQRRSFGQTAQRLETYNDRPSRDTGRLST